MNLNLKDFIESYFKIRTKSGQLVNFKFNEAQKSVYERYKKDYGVRPPRYIVLKARQLGISTLVESLLTAKTITSHNKSSLIVAHESDSTANIFNMTKRFIDNLPKELKPSQKYSNKKILDFNDSEGQGLDSNIRVMTVGEGARGSTFQYVHLSEVAFWEKPEEAMTAILQTVPMTNDSLVVIESTANGFNYFYQEWQRAVRGESDYTPIFIPWYQDKDYVRPYHKEEWTDYEKELKKLYSLSDEQLSWRRWAINNLCMGNEDIFRQEYPITPEEAFLTSGHSVFNSQLILERMKHITDPKKRGFFKYDYDGLSITNIRWQDDPRGFIKIYEEPNGDFTALGGDTAGSGEDYFASHVIGKNGHQLAVYHARDDEDLYTKQMYCLGMYYNSVIAIETNLSTYPNQELKRLRYPRLYVRKLFDRMQDTVEARYGFRTTTVTRPNIISNLVEIAREDLDYIVDHETLEEMLTFVYRENKPQASEGTHDDLVMSLAIAYECLNQVPKKRERRRQTDEDELFFDFY